jgi:hypothetical protein
VAARQAELAVVSVPLPDPWAGSYWTPADQAELDVSVWNLACEFFTHRERGCEACNPDPCPELAAWVAHKASCPAGHGDAPLTFALPCEDWRKGRVEHGRTCKRCNPCPHLQLAIAAVCVWRDARHLLSRAESLRAPENGAAE